MDNKHFQLFILSYTAFSSCVRQLLRRVKCDEARPNCLRCSRTGRICDGYSAVPSTPSSSRSTSSPASAISTFTSPEARSLQFFVEKTLANFQTFFPDDLWNTRVLQIAQTEQCIQDAVLALSKYHELYVSHQQWRQLDQREALKHYNLAIRQLLAALSNNSSQELPILSCLIFISIELLQGKTDAAMSLLKDGCRMIKQARGHLHGGKPCDNPSSDVHAILDLVQASLKRIAVQLLMLMGDSDPSLWKCFHDTFDDCALADTPFTCLSDAREALLPILTEQASPGLKGKTIYDILAHSAKLERWGHSYDALLADHDYSGKELSDSERRATALLNLHRRYLEINVSKYLHGQGDPCFWDRFTTEFDDIIDYAATAAGLDENYAHRNWATYSSPKAYFHIDLGFTSVLVSVIARCRDPFVRRKAIAVMLADRVQEGVFNGLQSARVAARVMELEEGRSGKECRGPTME
ncbi:hypothetical protein FHETE_1858 [Fusarium heterosporum]|uniref:Zn(2)-C6 fungal-type domain-containing protein n=1 Tax=Fusarium heterosporum TaxID=42747 RepID=A0A8H5X031_FUSHE|nr:hypothetical protein FHETE_1858 [Fusarium heterosporum]